MLFILKISSKAWTINIFFLFSFFIRDSFRTRDQARFRDVAADFLLCLLISDAIDRGFVV